MYSALTKDKGKMIFQRYYGCVTRRTEHDYYVQTTVQHSKISKLIYSCY